MWAFSRLTFTWLVPIVAILCAVGSQIGSDKADAEISTLKQQVTSLQPKPFKERLLEFLNDFDPRIISSLKVNDQVVYTGLKMKEKVEQLQKLCSEPEAAGIVQILSNTDPGTPKGAISEKGFLLPIKFVVKKALIE